MSCFSSFVPAYGVLARKGKGRTRATEVRTKLRNAATMLKLATGKKSKEALEKAADDLFTKPSLLLSVTSGT